MDAGALAVIPVVLAGVLILSGALKFGNRERTRASFVDLRVPLVQHLPWVAAWLPFGEIALAVALLAVPGWGYLVVGWGIAVFFGVLTVIVARAAARPEDVHCNCFGAYSTEPVGWTTVLRNLVLTALAVLVGVGVTGTRGFLPGIIGFDRQSVTWLVVLTVLGLALALLWFSNRSLARRVSGATQAGAPPGAPESAALAPGLASALASPPASGLDPGLDLGSEELVGVDGRIMTVRELGVDGATLIVFVQLECHACSAVLEALPEWVPALSPAVSLRIATSASPEQLAAAHPEVVGQALYGARGLRALLGVTMFPAAILVGRDVTLAAGPVYGYDEIESLVGGVVEALAQA